ncbi:MAG TPA: APC family permease [Candidatus Acidoferrum sp.]|nr:APC family permease [Candidatus Acidoferrum sp.]
MIAEKPDLIRAIGRWSLVALMVNFIIGAGIFGLPSAAAGFLGHQSPMAYLIAAAGMAVIAACVAEVASRFHETGGPYLYASAAFGRFIGLQTGWLLLLTRISSAAAVANVFIDYLSGFWPQARESVYRLAILTVLIGGLALINIRGVKMGTRVSNFFTIAKLTPLVVLVAAGLLFIHRQGSPVPAVESHPVGVWMNAVLLLVYAFSGFESALIPVGEVKSPGRNIPIALMLALPVVATIYFLVQVVVVHTLANSAQTPRPLWASAHVVGGDAMATIVALGALLSTFGSMAANMIANPRLTFAFAKQGDFPRCFAAIHRRYQTPYISIVTFAILFWALAVLGTFRWNATLSAISRLFAYIITCAALPMLRKQFPGQESFRLPGGVVFAVVGITFAMVLASRMSIAELIALAITAAISFLNWLVVRRNNASQR